MVRRSPLVETAAFLLVLAVALVYVSAHLPTETDYRLGADEGVYYRQAFTIVRDGPQGFRRLADEYVRDAAAQIGPPPLRIGHVLTAAAVLAVRPSIGALSVLSLACYVLLCLSVYFFTARFWDRRVAVLAGIFAAVSPLGWGLATRALMDTHHALFSTLALFTLLLWLSTGRERHFAMFAIALTWSLLVKETAWVYIPFALAAMLAAKMSGRGAVRVPHVIVIAAGVPAAVALVYVVAFGGPSRALAVAQIAHQVNVARPNAYLTAFGSGPWYEYLVDFLVLSPVVTLLFLLFCGRRLAVRGPDPAATLVLLFVCYVIASLALAPKNPRFVLPLDPLFRIGAAAMIVATARDLRSAVAAAAVTTALASAVVVTDARAFQRFFVSGRIYDPVAANLLSAVGSVPGPAVAAEPQPSGETYLNLSYAYYRLGDFPSAVRTARQAIALKPDSADAYNTLGASYAELREWQAAADALEMALRLRPDFALARNNLTWVRTELAKR